MATATMADFERVVALIENRLKNDWDTERVSTLTATCPDCGAAVPVDVKQRHVDWHISQFDQLRAIMKGFAKIGDAATVLSKVAR